VYIGQGELALALALFEEALDIAQTIGPRCPQTAQALKNLAALHKERGEPELAEAYARRAQEAKAPSAP